MARTDAFNAIKELYKTGRYSDMKIRCSDKVFNVHRAIVCMRSPVFARGIDGGFKEGEEGIYNVEEEELPVVEAMIEYLYYGTYSDPSEPQDQPTPAKAKDIDGSEPESEEDSNVHSNCWGVAQGHSTNAWDVAQSHLTNAWDVAQSHSTNAWGVAQSRPSHQSNEAALSFIDLRNKSTAPPSALFNFKVYIISDKYMIPELKAFASKTCEGHLERHWNTPEFTEAARLIWSNTVESDGLRKAVVTIAAKHNYELLDRGEFVEFLSEHGDFSVEVMKRAKQLSTETEISTPARGSKKRPHFAAKPALY